MVPPHKMNKPTLEYNNDHIIFSISHLLAEGVFQSKSLGSIWLVFSFRWTISGYRCTIWGWCILETFLEIWQAQWKLGGWKLDVWGLLGWYSARDQQILMFDQTGRNGRFFIRIRVNTMKMLKPNLRKRDPCTSTTIPMATRFAPDGNGCDGGLEYDTPPKINIAMENPLGLFDYLKMYFLLNMWIFHCHGCFRECTLTEIKSRSHLKHFLFVQIRIFFWLPQTFSNHLARKVTTRYAGILRESETLETCSRNMIFVIQAIFKCNVLLLFILDC